MRLVLGLDSGGTQTTLALADRQGRVQFLQRAAGLSPTQTPDWQDRLAALIAPLPKVEAAMLGLPFHGEVAAFTDAQNRAAIGLLGPKAQVQNDVQTAFVGALAGQPGVLILAGTGSMAWGGDGARQVRVGGWGDLIGDEGSGYWIGAQAVQQLSQCLDQRRADPGFVGAMLAALGVGPDNLAEWVYGQTDRRLAMAGIAPAVTALAAAGNVTAVGIVDAAVAALALHLTSAWRRLGRVGDLVWSYAGGVFRAEIVLRKLQTQIGTRPLLPCLPPVGGALLQAARNAGWTVDAAWTQTLAGSLAGFTSSQSRTTP